MADSNETTAYGFKIEFKNILASFFKKRKAGAGVELEADKPNKEQRAALDFECYKTHTKTESDEKIEG